MTKVIDAKSFIQMLDNGIKNINLNKKMLNDLNVFPVPDGDTGTNMFMTLKYGFDNCNKQSQSVGVVANEFASLAVFGARGNSGVILSQFFKGVAEGLSESTNATAKDLTYALGKGCEYAYRSVAKPVEGTMLTVIREATEKVKQQPVEEVKELVENFVKEAKLSLDRTPELLPILKKAGVVDSGASGIVCFFEGVYKYLSGTPLNENQNEEESLKSEIDFSLINKDTPLNFGYCVEGLIQLMVDEDDFDLKDFREDLSDVGNSVVASLEKDKVKVHVHTKKLAKVMDICQKKGEFLTIKIENMSVQNLAKMQEKEHAEKFLLAEEKGENFNIVAVATNAYLQRKFIEMGADVVILSQITPSSQDFIDAFSYLDKDIIVFPNSANSILAAVQAAGLCSDKQISVVNSRSVADCYSALSVLDFDTNLKSAVNSINQSINALYKVFVYHAQKEITYNGVKVDKNDFFSLENNEKILSVGETIEKVCLNTIKQIVAKKDSSVVTLVYADGMAEEFIEYLSGKIYELDIGVDVATVCSMETAYSLILVFE